MLKVTYSVRGQKAINSFLTPLQLEPLSDGVHWKVLAEFEYCRLRPDGSEEIITVPRGYVTDLASTPQWTWSLGFPPWGIYGKAAVLHDYCLTNLCCPKNRHSCDKLFFEAMTVLQVPTFKKYVMYLGVSLFSLCKHVLNLA